MEVIPGAVAVLVLVLICRYFETAGAALLKLRQSGHDSVVVAAVVVAVVVALLRPF